MTNIASIGQCDENQMQCLASFFGAMSDVKNVLYFYLYSLIQLRLAALQLSTR